MPPKFTEGLFVLLALGTLTPWIPAEAALVMGVVFSLTVGNPFREQTGKWTPKLLQISIVGLGATMNLSQVGRAGVEGLLYTIVGISFTMGLGYLLGKLFKTERVTSLLLSAGTAICGGSAIAAVASTIRARNDIVSVALATVFLLNASALLLFPGIGHYFQLDQRQFGLWSALAIHDTSSVVGASLSYGKEALAVATTVKLARALWIIPLTLAVGVIYRRQVGEASGKAKRPWFILGFVVVAAVVTLAPSLRVPGEYVAAGARRMLVLTLFLIGAGLTRATLKKVGLKPFAQGVLLWAIVASGTLAAIRLGFIH